jgi:hypothetical protein
MILCYNTTVFDTDMVTVQDSILRMHSSIIHYLYDGVG